MHGFDIFVVVVVGGLVLVGLLKGLVRLALGLTSIVVAIVVAGRYQDALAGKGFERLTGDPGSASVLAYAILWLAVMTGFAIVAFLAGDLLARVYTLRWADRLAGGVVGFAAGVMLVASIAIPSLAWLSTDADVVAGSRLAQPVLRWASFIEEMLPEEMGRRYRQRLRELHDEAGRRAPGPERLRAVA